MPRAKAFDKQLRGVFVAPWIGENGETILVAIAESTARIAERLVPRGTAVHPVADELWELLDETDPERPRLELVRGGKARR